MESEIASSDVVKEVVEWSDYRRMDDGV